MFDKSPFLISLFSRLVLIRIHFSLSESENRKVFADRSKLEALDFGELINASTNSMYKNAK